MMGISQYMFKMKMEMSRTQKLHVILLAETVHGKRYPSKCDSVETCEHFNHLGENLG